MSNLNLLYYVVIIYVATVIGIFVCEKASTELGVHDHGGIVWDEFVGFWIAMCPASPGITNLLVGFILFRVLDQQDQDRDLQPLARMMICPGRE